MIKLIATDVDGTLLNSHREVSPQNRAALIKAYEAGIIICYATGRLNPSLAPVKDYIGIPAPTITCNGAHAELATGTPIYSKTLASETRDFVLNYAQSRNITTNIYQPNRVLTSHNSEFLELYKSRVSVHPDVIGWENLAHEVATKMIFINDPDQNIQSRTELTPTQAEYQYDLTVSEPEYLEFLPQGVNKQSALIELCRHLNIHQNEVAAIGDFENDIQMIEWASIGAAVESGTPKLKNIADQIVPGHNENGLAYFVDSILQLNQSKSP